MLLMVRRRAAQQHAVLAESPQGPEALEVLLGPSDNVVITNDPGTDLPIRERATIDLGAKRYDLRLEIDPPSRRLLRRPGPFRERRRSRLKPTGRWRRPSYQPPRWKVRPPKNLFSR